MDQADTITWFEAIFKGTWHSVPPEEGVPPDVLDDSREWAARLLAERGNPYTNGRRFRQNPLLGVGNSPDKLETLDKDGGLRLYETLQHFVVADGAGGDSGSIRTRSQALEVIRSRIVPALSDEARKIVDEAVKTAPISTEELTGGSAVLLSAPKISINAIAHWFDRCNLFWLAGEVYVDFLKVYSGTAVAVFKPGLDWYPLSLRNNLGLAR